MSMNRIRITFRTDFEIKTKKGYENKNKIKVAVHLIK